MWKGETVSVVLPTYNEKDSIRACIQEFQATGYVDEIVVVNNNAAPGTSEAIAPTKAREVHESLQGYGAAIRRGFEEATGQYIVVCEPDGTFDAHDVVKLLAYARDFDLVLGSRTVKEFIWQGANMGYFLKWGNYAVAKMMEMLFDTVSLSDIGCTMRLIKRPALDRMRPLFTVNDNYFGPEMMLLACILDIPMVQIPVNYQARVGESSVTGNKWKAFRLGLRMISMILSYKWHTDGIRRKSRLKQRSATPVTVAGEAATPTIPVVDSAGNRKP
jgi:glycosyltransferase involved in cell wall biosynthesis